VEPGAFSHQLPSPRVPVDDRGRDGEAASTPPPTGPAPATIAATSSIGDSSPSVVSSADQDVPVHHLAKCAELIHTGAVEGAENECRAAIDENPKSPWPLLATASLLQPESFLQAAPPSSDTSRTERAELLQRAAALAPNLAIVHRELASIPGSSQAAMEIQMASALDPDQLETTQAANWWQTVRSFGLVNAFQLKDDTGTPPQLPTHPSRCPQTSCAL
jgi:hypothetical protein